MNRPSPAHHPARPVPMREMKRKAIPNPGGRAASAGTMRWMTCLLLAAAAGCGSGETRSPERVRYEADQAHCDSISDLEPARRSCMVYRGWPDGKYRR